MSTPAEVLGMARDLLDRATPETAGLWPRAAALLARQALEMAVDEYWSSKRLSLASCSTLAQLVCLREYLGDGEAAGRVHHAWNELSRACHQHPYELAPTALELSTWIESVEMLVAHQTGLALRGPRTHA